MYRRSDLQYGVHRRYQLEKGRISPCALALGPETAKRRCERSCHTTRPVDEHSQEILIGIPSTAIVTIVRSTQYTAI